MCGFVLYMCRGETERPAVKAPGAYMSAHSWALTEGLSGFFPSVFACLSCLHHLFPDFEWVRDLLPDSRPAG